MFLIDFIIHLIEPWELNLDFGGGSGVLSDGSRAVALFKYLPTTR